MYRGLPGTPFEDSLGSEDWRLGLGVEGSGYGVQCAGFRVCGLGFRVSGLSFRISGSCLIPAFRFNNTKYLR